MGAGFVSCRHGILPVPAPATLAILKKIPVYGSAVKHELVTPTGAAIIATLAESFASMPDMLIENTGYGAGKRNLESVPNLLRVITGSFFKPEKPIKTNYQKDSIIIVETCIDDMNPEFFGFLMERLFEDGAIDVYWIPIFMKKNRPATQVKVLCEKSLQDIIIHRILSETTSLGVRYYDVYRAKYDREQIIVETSYGRIQAKSIKDPDGKVRIVPEYEACRKIALEKNIPLRIIYDTIVKESSAGVRV